MCLLSGVERFPLFGGFQCTNFNGRAIGTGKIVRYIEVVRSWEGPLIEVPLYYAAKLYHLKTGGFGPENTLHMHTHRFMYLL